MLATSFHGRSTKWDHYAFSLTHLLFYPSFGSNREPIFASRRKVATCLIDYKRGVLWNGIPKTLS